jgi:hypothetical protein
MNERELGRLIQDVLERTASPAEAARLESLLARDAGAVRQHEELQETFETLAQLRMEPAPADLRGRIMDAVREESRGTRPSRTIPGPANQSRRSFPARRPAWLLGYGFLAGVVLVGVGFLIATGRMAPRSERLPVTGTMAPTGDLQRHELVAGTSRLGIEAETKGSRLHLRLSVEAAPAAPTQVVLEHDPALRLVAGRWNAAPPAGLETAPGRSSVTLAGPGPWMFEFAGLDARSLPVRLTWHAAGTTRSIEWSTSGRRDRGPLTNPGSEGP